MTDCSGCPFLYLAGHYCNCALGYRIHGDIHNESPTSENCQLFAVTYSLKDKRESINFVPERKSEL
jgi:hypothetical protein